MTVGFIIPEKLPKDQILIPQKNKIKYKVLSVSVFILNVDDASPILYNYIVGVKLISIEKNTGE